VHPGTALPSGSPIPGAAQPPEGSSAASVTSSHSSATIRPSPPSKQQPTPAGHAIPFASTFRSPTRLKSEDYGRPPRWRSVCVCVSHVLEFVAALASFQDGPGFSSQAVRAWPPSPPFRPFSFVMTPARSVSLGNPDSWGRYFRLVWLGLGCRMANMARPMICHVCRRTGLPLPKQAVKLATVPLLLISLLRCPSPRCGWLALFP
jgi:hypothetical protein